MYLKYIILTNYIFLITIVIKKGYLLGLYTTKFTVRKYFKKIFDYMSIIHPDIISYSALPIALITGILFYFSFYHSFLLIINIFLILIRMFLNTADGVVAMNRNRRSLLGEIVNALPDRYSDIFTVAGIALCPSMNPLLGISAISSMFLVSYTGMLGKALGMSWRHEGPLGKVERLALIMAFSVLQYFVPAFRILGQDPMAILLILFCILGIFTVFNRIRMTTNEITVHENKDIFTNIAVFYDSQTGNTELIAKSLSSSLQCECIKMDETNNAPYELMIICSPNIRNAVSAKANKFLSSTHVPYILVMSYGVPLWGIIGSFIASRKIYKRNTLSPLSLYTVPGKHYKFPFFKTHPTNDDIIKLKSGIIKNLRRYYQ